MYVISVTPFRRTSIHTLKEVWTARKNARTEASAFSAAAGLPKQEFLLPRRLELGECDCGVTDIDTGLVVSYLGCTPTVL
jgi:hypothetical protein